MKNKTQKFLDENPKGRIGDLPKQLKDQVNKTFQRFNTIVEQHSKKCLHDDCTECKGSGRMKNGKQCIHYISCPCPKCTPTY